jgi:ankyrin repeat protein
MKRKTILTVLSLVTLSLILIAVVSPFHQWRQHTFCRASWLGKTNTMKILFAVGANVSECSAAYVNPVVAASESGNPDAIDFLLKHGANVNQADRDGLTPLMYVAGAGHISSVRVLISRGADVNAVGRFGSASTIAARTNHPEIVALLKDAGATR